MKNLNNLDKSTLAEMVGRLDVALSLAYQEIARLNKEIKNSTKEGA